MTVREDIGNAADGSGVPVIDLRKGRPSVTDDLPSGELLKPVFFIGFMGAGKTSVARKMARNLGVASIDTDTFIERREGKRISTIFAEDGEKSFRSIETEALRDLAYGEPRLISCGGGIVVTPENREILRETGWVVYLKVSAEEAASRISDLSSRPLFADVQRAHEINVSREPLYEEVADYTIDTAGKTSGAIARMVQEALMEDPDVWQRK